MKITLAQPVNSIDEVVHTYGNMLFRLCLMTLGNASDAEDVVQETFIKYYQKPQEFRDSEHEKAWLITVATNKCRDMIRHRSRHPLIDIDEIKEFSAQESDNGIIDALMSLPEKYRVVMLLYYVEEYNIKEIAGIMGKTISAD